MNKNFYILSFIINENEFVKSDTTDYAEKGQKIGKGVSKAIKVIAKATGKKTPRSLKILGILGSLSGRLYKKIKTKKELEIKKS